MCVRDFFFNYYPFYYLDSYEYLDISNRKRPTPLEKNTVFLHMNQPIEHGYEPTEYTRHNFTPAQSHRRLLLSDLVLVGDVSKGEENSSSGHDERADHGIDEANHQHQQQRGVHLQYNRDRARIITKEPTLCVVFSGRQIILLVP